MNHEAKGDRGVEGTGGLGSSPIVAALEASPDGEGLTREELEKNRVHLTERQKTTRQDGPPIHQFRRSFPWDANSNVSLPFNLPAYTSTLLPEQSFHSTLLTTFSLPDDLPDVKVLEQAPGCTILLIYHIPPSVILDPFQIDQLHADGVLGDSVRFFGEIELELPLSKLSDRGREGSGLVLEIDPFKLKAKTEGKTLERNFKVGVPLHGRYLEPIESGEERPERTVDIEWPWVGLNCPVPVSVSSSQSSGEVPLLPSPFPSNLFSLSTQTFHSFRPSPAVSPAEADGPLAVPMVLPVGASSHLPFVEIGTTVAVWLGALYIVWRVFCRVRSGQGLLARPKTA